MNRRPCDGNGPSLPRQPTVADCSHGLPRSKRPCRRVRAWPRGYRNVATFIIYLIAGHFNLPLCHTEDHNASGPQLQHYCMTVQIIDHQSIPIHHLLVYVFRNPVTTLVPVIIVHNDPAGDYLIPDPIGDIFS